MVEFTDEASVEAWCGTRSREEVAVFAALTAALIYPRISRGRGWAEDNRDMRNGRAILAALVRGVYDDDKVIAASSTSSASDFVAYGAAASDFAAYATYAAAAAAVLTDYSEVSRIASQIEMGGVVGVMAQQLWRGAIPERIGADWDVIRSARSVNPTVWGFWIDWYEGLLEGRAPDWELWREVVLIDEAVWQTGPEAVAEAIAGIKRRRMVRVAPPLVLDEAARVFHVAAPSDVPDDVLGYVKGRVGLAFRNALAASKSNGFTESSYEAVTISSALDDPEVRADVLAGAFYDAALGFVANIGEVYPDDVALVNLKNVLYAASEEICEFDEQARQRCLRIAKLQIAREPSQSEIGDLGEMVAIAQVYSDDELAAILAKDKALIASTRRSPKWVKARFVQYMTTIGDYLERAKKGDAKVTWLVRRIGKLWEWFNGDGL